MSPSPRACPVGGAWPGIIEAYREHLPVTEATPVVTLQEGGTPLVPAVRLSEALGVEVRLKVEGANPTGSFKDRGMTMAITKAVEAGAEAVICASTGNTSASAAAYSARAGLTCGVIIPEGKIAMGKLAQALIHGARVVQIEGNFDEALRERCRAAGLALEFLPKPYRAADVMDRALRVLFPQTQTSSAKLPSAPASEAGPAAGGETDFASALERCGNDAAFLKALLHGLKHEAPSMLIEAEAAVRSGRWADAAPVLHRLRGDLLNLGLDGLAGRVFRRHSRSACAQALRECPGQSQESRSPT